MHKSAGGIHHDKDAIHVVDACEVILCATG